MKPTSYTLTIQILSQDKLGTIVAALAGEVLSFNITPHYNAKPKQSSTNSKSKLDKIFFESFVPGVEVTTAEVGSILSGHGFASSSASPMLSRLRSKGIVERIGGNKYRYIGLN